MPKKICISVTNDLTNDRRMLRIARSLTNFGYDVLLVGRKKKSSQSLEQYPFEQVRMTCFFEKGILFYFEFQVRLLFFFLRQSVDSYYAVDLDTLPPAVIAGALMKKKVIFDAHEYFEEVPELSSKPLKKWIWKTVGQWFVPKADLCFTVNEALADLFSEMYDQDFQVVRNMPEKQSFSRASFIPKQWKILYLGALNEGRGIDLAIRVICQYFPNVHLMIAGEGDLSKELRDYASMVDANHQVHFLGMLSGKELDAALKEAHIGLNILDGSKSKSYYFSLANKFFDYIQYEIPCITMNYPVYQKYIDKLETAVGIDAYSDDELHNSLNLLINNHDIYFKLLNNCKHAKNQLNWEIEEKSLIEKLKMLWGHAG